MFKYDVFPARATVNGKSYAKVRLLVTVDNRAVLFAHEGGNAEIVARADNVSAGRDKLKPRVVTITAEGENWDVTRTGGCGCHSPLKRINRTAAFA